MKGEGEEKMENEGEEKGEEEGDANGMMKGGQKEWGRGRRMWEAEGSMGVGVGRWVQD